MFSNARLFSNEGRNGASEGREEKGEPKARRENEPPSAERDERNAIGTSPVSPAKIRDVHK